MSSYIDSGTQRARALYNAPDEPGQTWSAFTEARLNWRYGPGRANTPQARADLAAWKALGTPKPEKCA